MPIKDPTIYPPYWRQFSEHIRFERAGNRCEKCSVRNGFWRVVLSVHGERFTEFVESEGEAYCLGGAVVRTSKIVLTVAHLDHAGGVCDCKDQTGRKCARPDHVLALCQACHLAMDMPKHIENRRQTMIVRNDERRLLFSEIQEVNNAATA